MSMFYMVDVVTPEGKRGYIFRDHDVIEFWQLEGGAALGPDDFPEAGDRLEAEDWGPKQDGPYRDVILQRTPEGWIEVESKTL